MIITLKDGSQKDYEQSMSVYDIAKDISEEFDVTPRRSASLLDMFSSMGQGLIPYGAQLLAAASLTGLTPFAIIPYCFYPLLMGISGLIFIFIKNKD